MNNDEQRPETVKDALRDAKMLIRRWKNNGELVPITGAGVSKNFRLPDRDTLIKKLSIVLQKKTNIEIEEEDTLLRIFRIAYHLRKKLRKDVSIAEIIREEFKKDYETTEEGILWLECLHKLVDICKIYVTFNFDDLFEIYINKIKKRPFQIRRPGKIIHHSEGQIDSFHLHGYIPILKLERQKDIDLPLVFDLLSYVEQYSEYLNQISISLLHIMTNYKCIFLGLHMSDPNLLRLIKMADMLRGNNTRTLDNPLYWGITLGSICDELASILNNWGILTPRLPLTPQSEPSAFKQIPLEILTCMGYERAAIRNTIERNFVDFRDLLGK